jgi:hypothetical protein
MNLELIFLDVANQTGIADGYIDGLPALSTAVFGQEGDDHDVAFGRAALWMNLRLDRSAPRAIWFEEPINTGARGVRTNPKTVRRLIGLWAVLTGVATARGVPCHSVAVSTVRAAVLGHGRLTSSIAEARAKIVMRSHGLSPKNDDEADAGCGWLWAAGLYRLRKLASVAAVIE